MKNRLLFHGCILMIVLICACSSDNETAGLSVTLTDSPGDFDAVNVDIRSVQVNSNATAPDSDKGWTVLNNKSIGIVNLLDYTNGQEITLANTDFPAGKISRIRLVLGTGNSIHINGNTFDLFTPSAQQSGLKLQMNKSLKVGVSYKIALDFDACRSVVMAGQGRYILKPVLRIISEEQSGALKGIVNPASENVAIYVVNGSSDTLATSFAPAGSPEYLVPGIPPGGYTMIFDPGEQSGYDVLTLDNILVSLGVVNEVDAVERVWH